MHLVLYFGQELGVGPLEMRISQFNKDGETLPVQLWTAIWDSRFSNASFIHFEEYFVKTLYKLYHYPCNYSLSDEIKRFLRPKDFNGKIDHNWGDLYCLEGATMIKVYGFEDAPFILPKMIPNKTAYLEIVRQMDYCSVMNFSSFGKQEFMPSTLCFGDFTILAKEGYTMILDKLLHYNMKRGPLRKNFDPKGYINSTKMKINFGGYQHVHYPFDDMI